MMLLHMNRRDDTQTEAYLSLVLATVLPNESELAKQDVQRTIKLEADNECDNIDWLAEEFSVTFLLTHDVWVVEELDMIFSFSELSHIH